MGKLQYCSDARYNKNACVMSLNAVTKAFTRRGKLAYMWSWTHLHTEANELTHGQKSVYTGRQMGLHAEVNAFTQGYKYVRVIPCIEHYLTYHDTIHNSLSITFTGHNLLTGHFIPKCAHYHYTKKYTVSSDNMEFCCVIGMCMSKWCPMWSRYLIQYATAQHAPGHSLTTGDVAISPQSCVL